MAQETVQQRLHEMKLDNYFNCESDPEDKFETIQCLGQGNYGKVFKAKTRTTGKTVAIKVLPIFSELECIKKEIAILKQCQCPYIVKFYGAYLKEMDLWLVLEYCYAGSIQDIIKLSDRTLNEIQIAAVCFAVLKGLEYLHDTRKIHRDIKAGNILLDKHGNAKLADFGVSA